MQSWIMDCVAIFSYLYKAVCCKFFEKLVKRRVAVFFRLQLHCATFLYGSYCLERCSCL